MDPSGSFFATSCSEKNIFILDWESGERLCTLVGHSGQLLPQTCLQGPYALRLTCRSHLSPSELVTCMRFSQDCRHLITASGDRSGLRTSTHGWSQGGSAAQEWN